MVLTTFWGVISYFPCDDESLTVEQKLLQNCITRNSRLLHFHKVEYEDINDSTSTSSHGSSSYVRTTNKNCYILCLNIKTTSPHSRRWVHPLHPMHPMVEFLRFLRIP